MKICYKINWKKQIGTDIWYLLKYVVEDPSHDSGPPMGGIKTTFAKGDVIDIAFPVGDPDAPIFKSVTALVQCEPHGTHVPERGWMITVDYDSSGVDFGEGYRVLLEAKLDNIRIDSFEICFIYKGTGEPGKQAWGFRTANDPGQHTETGETSPCR